MSPERQSGRALHFGPASNSKTAQPRSSGQHRGDSPILWKLNRTSVPGPPRKRNVRLWRMGSMTSGFRHSHAGLAE